MIPSTNLKGFYMDTSITPKTHYVPDSVEVLGRTFKVRLMAPDEHTDADGMMELDKQLISLRLNHSEEYNKDTTLHEIIHAIDEVMNLGMEEHQVHLMAVGLISVLAKNPELSKWLISNGC